MPLEERWREGKYNRGQKSRALVIKHLAHPIKQKKAEQRQHDDATLQRNDTDSEECERNRGQISFPSSACIVGLTVHVEGEIAPFQNVFTHQADDRLVAVHMRLRCQQNRKARCRDNNKQPNEQCVPAHQRLVLTSPSRSWHRTRRSTIDSIPLLPAEAARLSAWLPLDLRLLRLIRMSSLCFARCTR